MTIKRTQKYVAAVRTALKVNLSAKNHSTADELYQQLEQTHHWDSKQQAWIENPILKPHHEIDKHLVRIRVTAHLQGLEAVTDRVITALNSEGLIVQDASHIYANHRKPDGGGRVYLSVFYE